MPMRPRRVNPGALQQPAPRTAQASHAAVKLLRDFHSRNEERLWHAQWRPPEVLWAIGVGQMVYYSSDKQDPSDESDPGGVWKGYKHEHEKDTLVYLTPSEFRQTYRSLDPVDVIYPRWPHELVWLGSADGYDVQVDGRIRRVTLDGQQGMKGLQLWGFPNRRALVAAPAQGGREEECVLWAGPHLTITWAGIEG